MVCNKPEFENPERSTVSVGCPNKFPDSSGFLSMEHPLRSFMPNFNCTMTDGKLSILVMWVMRRATPRPLLKHTAKPLGIFPPSISAEMFTIAACTHVHRTERASVVNSHSCDCDPGFQETEVDERRCGEILAIAVVLSGGYGTCVSWRSHPLCPRQPKSVTSDLWRQVWPLHRRPFGKPELATDGNCSIMDKLQLAWPEAALRPFRRSFGIPELAAGGNCSRLDKLHLAWPEAALPRCAAGHGRSVLAAACLAVSRFLAMAHPRGDIPRRPSNQTFVAVPKLKRNTSLRPPSALVVLRACGDLQRKGAAGCPTRARRLRVRGVEAAAQRVRAPSSVTIPRSALVANENGRSGADSLWESRVKVYEEQSGDGVSGNIKLAVLQ